jgi:hypothetical protein
MYGHAAWTEHAFDVPGIVVVIACVTLIHVALVVVVGRQGVALLPLTLVKRVALVESRALPTVSARGRVIALINGSRLTGMETTWAAWPLVEATAWWPLVKGALRHIVVPSMRMLVGKPRPVTARTSQASHAARTAQAVRVARVLIKRLARHLIVPSRPFKPWWVWHEVGMLRLSKRAWPLLAAERAGTEALLLRSWREGHLRTAEGSSAAAPKLRAARAERPPASERASATKVWGRPQHGPDLRQPRREELVPSF